MRIDGQRFFTRISINEMGSPMAARKLLQRRGLLKAAIGIEPMIKVLQTSALPLGYAAAEWG